MIGESAAGSEHFMQPSQSIAQAHALVNIRMRTIHHGMNTSAEMCVASLKGSKTSFCRLADACAKGPE